MKKPLFFLIIILLTPLIVYAQNPSSNITEGYNPDYNVLPIILFLFMLYFITYLLYDNENIKRRSFKQVWSLILVGSFLFVGISGIILSILADYHLVLPSNFNLLFWHVEAGIILAITLIFHIHIHKKRFQDIIST
jgi:hypothetical protein